MDSSSIYYDSSSVTGNLRFNTEYEEYNSDSSSPNNDNENTNNDNLSDSTLIGESESCDLYHNDSDDITTNLISTTPNNHTINHTNNHTNNHTINHTSNHTSNLTASNNSMKSIALSNSNVLKSKVDLGNKSLKSGT